MEDSFIVLTIIPILLNVLLYAFIAVAAVILFLILLIVFCPLRYKAGFVLHDPEGHEEPDVKEVISKAEGMAEISWLLHFITIKTAWSGGKATAKLKILWIQRDLMQAKEETEPHSEEPEKEEEKAEEKLSERLKRMKEGCRYGIKVLRAPSSERALKKILRTLKKMIKKILPRTWQIEGTLGLSDPALTGKVFEVISILYPYIHMNVRLMPEFMLYRFDIKGSLAGRLRIGTIIAAALSIVLNKDVRRLIRRSAKGTVYFKAAGKGSGQINELQPDSGSI